MNEKDKLALESRIMELMKIATESSRMFASNIGMTPDFNDTIAIAHALISSDPLVKQLLAIDTLTSLGG